MQRFAYELRKLRQEAGGLTYRMMAQRAGYSVATLSRAAAGEQLPSLEVALAYAQACGADVAEWERRWRAASEEAAVAPEPGDEAQGPYRGLARFEPADAGVFFGRDALVAQLAERVHAHRLVVVVGASGSGKSSLLRAGLIPLLQNERSPGRRPATVRILAPGRCPMSSHRAVVTADPGPGDTVVVVDQLEELFTLCADPSERAAFLDLLLTAVEPESKLRVVIAVRADFFARCAEHHGLAAALRDATLLVGPMSPAELRQAIVKPAVGAGLIVERELTTKMIADVSERPGGLPLMSHALLETWRRRKGRALTLAAYRAVGGVDGAIAVTAEDLYTRLSTDQAHCAQRILLRLITPGQGAPDTQRPADREELDGNSPGVSEVLERLVKARLVTVDGRTVHLAHEALIAAWPRLRNWIDNARERLRLHRRLTDAAQVWQTLDRDPGALLRGARLAAAEEAFAARSEDLTSLEREYLGASSVARQREQQAVTRARLRLHTLTVSVSVLVALALVAGMSAWQLNRTNERQALAATARRTADLAGSMRLSDPQRALQLSVAAYKIADTLETRSALLSAFGQKEQDKFQVPTAGTAVLLSDDGRTVISAGAHQIRRWNVTTHRELPRRKAPGGTGATVLAASGDGNMLAVRQRDGSMFLWDIAAQRTRGHLLSTGTRAAAFGALETVVFGASGRTLVTIAADGVGVRLWDTVHQRLLFAHSLLRPVQRNDHPPVAVSPDDRFVAWCQGGGPVHLYDVPHHHEVMLHSPSTRLTAPCRQGDPNPLTAPARVLVTPDGVLQFSPNSRYLGGIDGTGADQWDTSSGRPSNFLRDDPPIIGNRPAEVEPTPLREIRFDRGGTFFAGMSKDAIVLWRVGRPGKPIWTYPLNSDVSGFPAFDTTEDSFRYLDNGSPSGPTVRTLDLNYLSTGAWHQPENAEGALSLDGRASAVLPKGSRTAEIDVHDPKWGTVRSEITGLPYMTDPEVSHTYPLMSFDARGTLLAYAVAPGGTRALADRVRVWDTIRRHVIATVRDSANSGIAALTLSPDGKRLAILTRAAHTKIRICRLPDCRHPITVRGDYQTPLVFNHDGTLLYAGVHSDVRPLTSVSSGQLVDTIDTESGTTERKRLGQGADWSLSASPDGRYIAVGDLAGWITLWDASGTVQLGVLPGPLPRGDSQDTFVIMAFSHDGRTLSVAGQQGMLQLWDTSSRQLMAVLPTPGDTISSLAFSSDDLTLYAAGSNTRTWAYSLDARQITERVCQRTGSLSRTSWRAYFPGIPYRAIC
ncbi:helix-turn-helix domain-containing protein [Streptomyces sp. NPDC046759]|uniref:nSTAND1 domain-containing NTPase n=1 Tax=Streptomyces sp. NPDC046759 TaxID=3155019 RepID=UPI0033EC7465